MQLADPLTKDSSNDSLRAAVLQGRYHLADEEMMLQRRAEEKARREKRGRERQEENLRKQQEQKNARNLEHQKRRKLASRTT